MGNRQFRFHEQARLLKESGRTCIECLFGDEPGRTLGFTPRGLSPWAGLALALHDARPNQPLQPTGPA